MTATTRSAWRWVDERFDRPFLATPPDSSTERTVVLNSIAAVLLAVVALLALPVTLWFTSNGYDFNGVPCSAQELWGEQTSVATEQRWFPPGPRCTFTEPDGTTAVVEPGAFNGVATVVLGLAWSSLVLPGLGAPPTRFWRRATWTALAVTLVVALVLLAAVTQGLIGGALLSVAAVLGIGLVGAVPTTALAYLLHPEERWWVFPSAWLGWSATVFTVAVIFFVVSA